MVIVACAVVTVLLAVTFWPRKSQWPDPNKDKGPLKYLHRNGTIHAHPEVQPQRLAPDHTALSSEPVTQMAHAASMPYEHCQDSGSSSSFDPGCSDGGHRHDH